MNRERLLERIKGIKALADRGENGERDVAAALLDELMEKYELTLTDIECEEVNLEWFTYRDRAEKKLLSQIIYMVVGYGDIWTRRGKRDTGTYCTTAQRLEIELNFHFYKKALAEEYARFYSAFVQKNYLYPSDDLPQAPDDDTRLSKEELVKMAFMMEGIDKRTPHKQLAAAQQDGEEEQEGTT